jgi:hypothetical protein
MICQHVVITFSIKVTQLSKFPNAIISVLSTKYRNGTVFQTANLVGFQGEGV